MNNAQNQDIVYIKWMTSRRKDDPTIEMFDCDGNKIHGHHFKWAKNFMFRGSMEGQHKFAERLKKVFGDYLEMNISQWSEYWGVDVFMLYIEYISLDEMMTNPNIKFVNPRPRNWGKG